MNKKKKWIITAIVLVVFCLILGLYNLLNDKTPASDDAAKAPIAPRRQSTLNVNGRIVRPQRLTDGITTVGNLLPDEEVDLSFETSGKIVAINYLKRRNRTELFAPSDTEKLADRLSLEEEVLSDERKLALSAALDTLPKDMRAAVHLVYFENMSYEEAARIMKKNRKQVDNLLYRAKAALRSAIGEEGMKLL